MQRNPDVVFDQLVACLYLKIVKYQQSIAAWGAVCPTPADNENMCCPAAGKYQSAYKATSCIICPINTWTNVSGTPVCPFCPAGIGRDPAICEDGEEGLVACVCYVRAGGGRWMEVGGKRLWGG